MLTKSDVLMGELNRVLEAGEVPYKANLAAYKSFLREDGAEEGIKHLRVFQASVPAFIGALEELADVATRASRSYR